MPQAGTTYLQAVNLVLRRLRESTMTDFSAPTANQQHVMDVVNTVKAEVENAWLWDALRDTYQVTTTPNVITYAFTGATAGARILAGYNATAGIELRRESNKFFDDRYLMGHPVQTGSVAYYVENSVDNNYDLKIDVWPSPASTQVLNFNLYALQADLVAASNVMKAPVHVVIEGTLAYMLAERGDEGADKQMQRYQRLLGDAVAADAGRHPEELDWTPV